MKRKLLSLLLIVLTVIIGTALTSCGDGGLGLELAAPENVKYDGKTISWSSVENADSYTVKIDDGEEYTVTSPKFPYSAKGKQFSVTVTAVSDAGALIKSGEAKKLFFPLDTVNELTVSKDGTLTWPVVENADAYEIQIDGEVVEEVSATSFSGFPAGTHQIAVRPIVSGDDSYYSSFSAPKSITVLGAVAKDDITYANGKISWKYVTGASHYELYVNGTLLEAEVNGTTLPYDAQNADFDVRIKAIGNGSSTFDGAMSEPKAFIFLDTVANVRVEDGILMWDEVGGADGYKLELNGTLYNETLTETKFDKIVAGIDTAVRLMPISNDTAYFSDWSTSKTVHLLSAPEIQWNSELELDGEANNNAFWNLISGATGYMVRLTLPDGKVTTEVFGETQKAYANAYLKPGTYKLEVKALAPANSSNLFDSAYSMPVTVVRLAAPERADSNFITSSPSDVSKGFTVTFKGVNSAIGYRLYKDNVVVQNGTSTQFAVGELLGSGVMEAQNYNYKIQAVGTVERVNGRIYATLSSLSDESLAFKIQVLPMPQNTNISGFNYTYGQIQGSYGYSVDVGGQSYTSQDTTHDLSQLGSGSYQVRVCAMGNGADVLPSNYTAPINVLRLDAPSNIRIDTSDASEGVLTYDTVLYATGYEIIFDNSDNAIPVSNMMNINQYIKEQGTTVCMQSIANKFNEDKTVYYMTSKRSPTVNFVKLAAPTFGEVAFTNTEIFWKAPDNMNSQFYTPTYEVYYEDGTLYNGEKNGTRMDISYLKGGEKYIFYVKAIGDGKGYINSAKSTPVEIFKLATPTLDRVNGQYSFKGVVNAVSYVIYVDGVEVGHYTHEVGKTYTYTPDFTELKTYKVEIEAIGDNGYTTINSDKGLIEQKTAQLTTPDFKVYYDKPSYEKTGKVVIEITEQPKYAAGYSYTIGGSTAESKELIYSLTPSSVTFSQPIYCRVYALGGNFDEEGTYYIDSQSEGGTSAKYSITLLATPNNDENGIKLTADGYLTWTGISGAIKYEVEITIGGKTTTYNPTKNYLTLDLGDLPASVTIRIRAVGDGANIVTGAWAERTITVNPK